MSRLTHLDDQGRARMVDVSAKSATAREAVAEGLVRMSPATRDLALSGSGRKGDVRATAEIAGVMAAKRTADLIPLCHPLALSTVEVAVEPDDEGLRVTARVKLVQPSGDRSPGPGGRIWLELTDDRHGLRGGGFGGRGLAG